ncbi:hypothetical protein HYH03_007481 [Edaphochlamys debaryana]|uniref:Uncharacterized protein n=1 Tax=Edaphochlamys debaryana TaxID=47281 RepID=A0A835Y3A0_9CHLO|nr:hypothetical protein HYH03_007481 [Edaphochlamys debaryana]|eukprot:KAG2494429.1 hypothetical protein HYH03_007481 [Edaphochlamys debaryana]
MASPPKQHAPALKAWASLAGRLLRAPGAPASTAPAAEAAASQPSPAAPGPGSGLQGARIVEAVRLTSAEELRAQVEQDARLWIDGTGPGDPPLTDDDRASFTAAELACLLAGRRGVALLQLHVGWEEHDRAPPYGPYRPLVLRMLREALARPDLVSYASAVPAAPGGVGGGAAAGFTMVLTADKEPFRSWGAHLASFGCQAALEAQSPYYKVLIGRVLGYKPENIAHHVQGQHGQPPSAEVLAAVEAQLKALSPKPAVLPWNVGARGGGRKKAK